jgi:DNA-directed RNA polymerase subunit H (RpoH/RPB5)
MLTRGKKMRKSIVEKHILIPKHTLCSDKEKEEVLSKYSATIAEMPKILFNDPAISGLKAKLGDMIRVERVDEETGKTFFYRVVANE